MTSDYPFPEVLTAAYNLLQWVKAKILILWITKKTVLSLVGGWSKMSQVSFWGGNSGWRGRWRSSDGVWMEQTKTTRDNLQYIQDSLLNEAKWREFQSPIMKINKSFSLSAADFFFCCRLASASNQEILFSCSQSSYSCSPDTRQE